MTLKATLVAALPEARRISNFLERDWSEDGVVVALDEAADGEWAVAAYFEEGAAPQIEAELRNRLGSDAFGALRGVEELPDENWVALALQALTPVAIGRFVLHGAHDRGSVPPGRIGIEIDAGQAFGSGHHATTAGCLALLNQLMRARRHGHPLDLGTGSGVLAIALAKLLRGPVLASDIDPVAVRVARGNAKLNAVGPRVTAVVAPGLAHAEIRRRAPFDLIVANILAEPLMRLAPALAAALAPGGDLILSGLLLRQRERVVSAFRGQGLRLRAPWRFGEWSVLHLSRAHRPTRHLEPLPYDLRRVKQGA
jgi:ribosomal protein L11 methyltransferase